MTLRYLTSNQENINYNQNKVQFYPNNQQNIKRDIPCTAKAIEQ